MVSFTKIANKILHGPFDGKEGWYRAAEIDVRDGVHSYIHPVVVVWFDDATNEMVGKLGKQKKKRVQRVYEYERDE